MPHGSFFLEKQIIVDATSFNDVPFYAECVPLVEGFGFFLIDLKIAKSKTLVKIRAEISPKDPGASVSVADCAKVHHALLPRLQALLKTENTSMELTSPGIEHKIKDAREFVFFRGKRIRVWSRERSDWITGVLCSSDEKSIVLEGDDGSEICVPFSDIAKAKFA